MQNVDIVKLDCCHADERIGGYRYFCQVRDHVDKLCTTRKVVRLFIYHPNTCILSVALPMLLAHIRAAGHPVVMMVAVNNNNHHHHHHHHHQSTTAAIRVLKRSCDIVLEAEAFVARRTFPPPPEFGQFQGLLKVRRVHGGKQPPASLYGLKRNARRLSIQMLHIPPEDYAQGGGSVGSGARSGGGTGCAVSGGIHDF
jgi:hypothetical protein